MTRAVWIDEGNDASDAILKANGITQTFFSVRDSKYATLAHLNTVKARGFQPGLYLCSQGEGWPSHLTMTGPQWADWAYDTVQKKIAPGTSGSFPLVDLNCEVDDVGWLTLMFERWRQHSPKRVTAWSMCAHKYPLFANAGFVADLVRWNITLKPQCYVDSPKPMTRVESASELDGWQSIGIPRERIAPMLDAGQLGEWWGTNAGGATAYTQGRLGA